MLGVISLHSNLGKTDVYPTAFVMSRIAGISIPLFFMVSGYLMLDREIDQRYLIRKIIRILQFVFIIVFCHWMIVRWFTNYSFLAMLKTFVGSFLQRGRFGVFWYLGSMCIIYVVLPLIQKVCSHKSQVFVLLGLLGGICFVFFELDAELSLEKTFIPQTFRIWYWLFYFVMGGVIKRYSSAFAFSFITLLLYAVVFLLFVYWFKYKISGIEYFFGAFICWVYAFVAFTYFISKNITSNFVSLLSSLFLPCYALHMTVIGCYQKYIDTTCLGLWSPVVDYILVVILTIGISLLIVHIPIVKNIFKI